VGRVAGTSGASASASRIAVIKDGILQQIDTLWREHLQSMDALRESVGLRGYGQKDPLIEYKNEGYDMFLEMMTQMRRNVIYSMFMFQPRVLPEEASTVA